MTRMQKALMENPTIIPELLVAYHCPAEYGLMQAWPPEACPSGGAPCIECWNREVPDDA
jgi:hypothetical protein